MLAFARRGIKARDWSRDGGIGAQWKIGSCRAVEENMKGDDVVWAALGGVLDPDLATPFGQDYYYSLVLMGGGGRF